MNKESNIFDKIADYMITEGMRESMSSNWTVSHEEIDKFQDNIQEFINDKIINAMNKRKETLETIINDDDDFDFILGTYYCKQYGGVKQDEAEDENYFPEEIIQELINDIGLKLIDSKFADKVLNDFEERYKRASGNTSLYDDFTNEYKGMYYLINKDGVFTGIDNTTGNAWTEDFKTFKGMIHWMIGKDLEDVREEENSI